MGRPILRRVAAVSLLLASSACGSGSAGGGIPDDSNDEGALSLGTTPAYYFISRQQQSPPAGMDCFQRVNGNKARTCFGSLGAPKLNVEESMAFRDAVDHERVIAHASLFTFNGGAAAGAQMLASDAWVSATGGAPTKPLFLVKKAQGTTKATRLNSTTVATAVTNLDLSAAGSANDVQAAQADLDGAGLVVSGDLKNGALVADRFFRHVSHVRTMYDSWNFDQTPGEHLNGSTFELPAGAQLSLSLTSYTNGTKVEADRITGFTAPAPVVVTEDRSAQPEEKFAFYNFRIPEGAAAGQTYTVHSTPAAGFQNDAKWDFSFTIKVGSACAATIGAIHEARQCE